MNEIQRNGLSPGHDDHKEMFIGCAFACAMDGYFTAAFLLGFVRLNPTYDYYTPTILSFIIKLIQHKEFVIRRISMVIICLAMVAFAMRKDAVEKGFPILQ